MAIVQKNKLVWAAELTHQWQQIKDDPSCIYHENLAS